MTILDPHATTAAITRTFGLHVFDTLFAMNDKGEIKPQMVERLRQQPRQADLDLHPARRPQVARRPAPVTAEDCVASLKRWSVRDPLGKMLMADTDQCSTAIERRRRSGSC